MTARTLTCLRSELIDVYTRVRVGRVSRLRLGIEEARYEVPVQNSLFGSVQRFSDEPQLTLPLRTIRARRSGRDFVPKIKVLRARSHVASPMFHG